MTHEEFARAFENCELSNECFHHRDHIRLAWIYFRRYGETEGTRRIADSIQRFAAHAGKSEKYHHTITVAWMRLVASAGRSEDGDFDAFLRRFPELLDKSALKKFYSDAVLNSEMARTAYVEPDLWPFSKGIAQSRSDVLK